MWHDLRAAALRGLGIVVVANLLFLAVMLLTLPNAALVATRVRTAFAAGELDDADYRPWDSRRGSHQYNDCVVLQLLINANPSRLHWALAPRFYEAEINRTSQCGLLRALVTPTAAEHGARRFQYARYWHGYSAVAGAGLRAMEVRTLRVLLKALVWAALAVLALAAYRSGPRVRRTALAIAATGALLWALPFFAPNLTHGPGDALVLLGLAGVAGWPRMSNRPGLLVPYAAVFGAVVAFFEMLTGQLPTAAGWLAVLTLAAARDEGRTGGGTAPSIGLVAVIAFGAGATITVLVKQVLALVLVAPEAGTQFVALLRFYTSVPDFEPGWPGLLEPFGRLLHQSSALTFGSVPAAYGLVLTGTVAWAVAARGGWQSRRTDRGHDVLVILAASLIPVVWALLLPSHTYIHAGFMVRMLVVPISLAPVALFWPQARVGMAAKDCQAAAHLSSARSVGTREPMR